MPSLLLPLTRRPRLRRPDDWTPRFGERVWFARGGCHRLEIVRVGLFIREDSYPIAIRAGTHGAMIEGDAPLSRLWPLPGWEAERARREASDQPED